MKSLSPYDSTKFSVLEVESVNINDLLEEFRRSYKESFIKSQLQMNGYDLELDVSETNFGGERLWFICPQCKKRYGVIYKHPLGGEVGCRKCLNISY